MGMERYRAIVRLEEIRSLLEQGDIEAAKSIADSIKRERLKDSSDLFLLAEVYRKCGEFAIAKDFLLRVYEKKVTWRVLEELMEVCLAEKNPGEAEQYLEQYVRVSGGDPRNYMYEYRIGRQKHRPDEELLPVLQTLKAEEYSEKYAYELAKLYHKLGREQECMAECADLILWFGEGTYVERAKALQAYYRGELSVDDIRVEAERRIKEAEERRIREEEERRAYEEEQRRLEEEQRRYEEEQLRIAEEQRRYEEEQLRIAEEQRRLEEELQTEEEIEDWEEEEQLALAELCQAVAQERLEASAEEAECLLPPEAEPAYETLTTENEFFAEAAVAVTEEPMWEEDDGTMFVPEEVFVKDTFTEVALEQEPEAFTEPESYEQISLFASDEEIRETVQPVSPLGKELSARLEERDLIFEDYLHEFSRIERVRKQLVHMLEMVVTVRKKCHCLIITGEERSGRTTLGTYLARLLYELSYVKSPRVAKINGERLNRMHLPEKKEQLQDVCLIIECAGSMTEETAEALLEFIQKYDVLGTVILEDTANAMNRLLRNQAECNRVFNNRVHLPKYDSDELLCFATGYIREQDYELAPDARRVLEQRLEYITRVEQKEGRLAATMTLVRGALENADYRNQGAILAMASAGNFLAAEALMLTAEDFGVIQ